MAEMYLETSRIYIFDDEFSGYADWKSLQEFLAMTVNYDLLVHISTRTKEEVEPAKLADDQAEIIWFNQAKGFGFARANGYDKNPILHRN